MAKKSISIDAGEGVEKVLIDNFVSLQKVMTNLAVKFENLSSQISKLLELFEISAKTLAERGVGEGGMDKGVVEKLDNLLEQNKIIAKGLALLHEKDSSGTPSSMPMRPMQGRAPYDFSKNPRMRR